jgi:hypothetical protein
MSDDDEDDSRDMNDIESESDRDKYNCSPDAKKTKETDPFYSLKTTDSILQKRRGTDQFMSKLSFLM